MDWDHLAERDNQQYFAAWLQLLSQQSPGLPLRLASEHYRRARATEVSSFTTGSYNICCTVAFEDGFRVVTTKYEKNAIEDSQRLSDRMAQSMKNELFWFCLAARKSFMFDDIYCTFLDRKYFGRESLENGVSLLPQEELDELEGFVRVKMQQAGKSRLDEHLSYD
ncbi:uncharacterized protein N7458_004549, partial [Penicillium daleae]